MTLLQKIISQIQVTRNIRFSPETIEIGEKIMPDLVWLDNTYHTPDGDIIAKENMAGEITLVKCKLRIKHTILQMIAIEMEQEKMFKE